MDSKEAEAFAELSMEGGKDAEGEDAEYFEGDARLDEIAEALEEIIMDDGFQSRVARWCKQNCDAFTSAEENKLEYTPLFEAYQAMTEGHVETALRSYGISMAEVEALLVANADNLGADIFDVLVSMGDFGECPAALSCCPLRTPIEPCNRNCALLGESRSLTHTTHFALVLQVSSSSSW